MATTITNELASAGTHSEAEARPGVLRRAWRAIVEARHRAAEREIERYIMNHGGVLTDRIEQELSRNFGAPAGRAD